MSRPWLKWVALWGTFLAVRTGYFPAAVALRELYEVERTALCLAERGFLGDPYPGHDGPSAHAAPLYPTVVAAVYAAGGDWPTRFTMQAALGTLLSLAGMSLLPAVGRAVVGSGRAGWAAAWLFAVLPFEYKVQIDGQWETAASFLGANGLLLQMRATQAAGWRVRSALRLGGLTGVLVLLNPSFGPALVLLVLGELAVRADRRAVLAGGVVAGLTAGAVIAPWVGRNFVQLDGFCPVRSNAGLELWFGNNAESDGTAIRAAAIANPLSKKAPFKNPAEVVELRRVGELNYMNARRQEAVDWIKANPDRFAELTARRVALYWFPPADLWYPVGESDAFRAARTACYWGVSLGAAVGLAGLWGRDRGAFVAAAAVLLGLTAAYYITVIDPRHTLPLRGLTLVLAADAALRLFGRSPPEAGNHD